MPTAAIFSLHLLLGYVPWLLCFGTYAWPRLKSMDAVAAHRAIATLHSFRFFGLVFLVPGVTGPHLPAGFATFAAFGDLATGLLAIRHRPLFWLFTAAFNVVGMIDLVVDYYHGATLGLPALAGELGAAYAIPVLYVPLLMITHCAAFCLMARGRSTSATPVVAGEAAS